MAPGRFGLAVVGTHLAFDADATALAIVAADGDGRYLDTATLTPADEAALAAWLADPERPKALHEAKLAMHDLEGRGWTLCGVTSDTALAAYLVRPGQRSFALDDPRCAICVANCARIPQSSNNFHCSMTPKASTTKRCRR